MLKRLYSGGLSHQACLFLDRDGVINERREGAYVTAWRDFVFRRGAIAAMRLASAELPIVIVTNQRCVARGLASAAEVEAVMDRMSRELRAGGVRLAAWYACPHDVKENCGCRKPRPGMLLEAAADLNADLASSFMIGDSPSDVEAGNGAGCKMSLLCDAELPQSLLRAVEQVMGVSTYAS